MDIVLMKSAEVSDAYVSTLEELGAVTCIPTLAFQFINLDELKTCIALPHLFSGIIFTSKRAVEAVRLCHVPCDSWMSKPCYVVGEATFEVAKKLGFSCVGKESGNAESLALQIVEDTKNRQPLPLLFVCGQLKKDTLPNILDQNGISYKAVTSYETGKEPDLFDKIKSHSRKHGNPSHIVFFSPSGYKFSYGIWKEVLGSSIDNVCKVAIGPSTASEFAKEGINVTVADKPNPQAVLKAIAQQ